MDSSLKTRSVQIKGLGRKLEIRGINGATQIALLEEFRAIRERSGDVSEDQIRLTPSDNIRIAAITCAGCVVEWEGETPESILKNHSATTILEIAAEAQKGRSRRPKNSARAPSDDSSSGSQ